MEVKEIPENQRKKDLYNRFADKMKAISNSADEEVQASIKLGLDITSKKQYFPPEFSTYLLELKMSQNLPVSLLPDSLFERPIFKGREEFFQRLASELISFGLSYQRVYLKAIPLSKIASLLHTHRPWWKCDIQDIEKSLSILKKNAIVQENEDGYTFEPFSISSEIRTFLTSISDGINEYGEISIPLINQLLPWDGVRIKSALEILANNRICILDEAKQMVYFPGYQKGG
ncbi:MAG: hypothetical protein KAT16_03495 [Candidatus Heimdallarchaeota archaeon]|nr:hypothetical protein [Candidatus Heimdallarchaeota archaeon]